MRVLFAGTPRVAVPALEALLTGGFDVVAVLTRPDAPVGRKRVLTPSPVARRAAELGIEVIHAAAIDDDVAGQIAGCRPDIAAIVAYGALIPAPALTIPAHGWINLHFSLLPAWRGAAPVQHAIINGDDITGASTFQLEAGLDTGPILGQLTERIRGTDTSGELLGRLADSGAVLLTRTLAGIEDGTAAAVAQQGGFSSAPKLRIDDGRIDWTQPALAIDRRVRGVTPEPGAWTTLAGQRVKLAPALLRPDVTGLTPGECDTATPDGICVGTGSHAVELAAVQPAGKKMMAARDWARGLEHRKDVVFE